MNNGIDSRVKAAGNRYGNDPANMERGYKKSKSLELLLALQNRKDQLGQAKNEAAMQTPQGPQTVMQQRQNEVAQMLGIAGQQQMQRQQKAQQRMARPPQRAGIAGIPPQRKFAQRGIGGLGPVKKFAEGGPVPSPANEKTIQMIMEMYGVDRDTALKMHYGKAESRYSIPEDRPELMDINEVRISQPEFMDINEVRVSQPEFLNLDKEQQLRKDLYNEAMGDVRSRMLEIDDQAKKRQGWMDEKYNDKEMKKRRLLATLAGWGSSNGATRTSGATNALRNSLNMQAGLEAQRLNDQAGIESLMTGNRDTAKSIGEGSADAQIGARDKGLDYNRGIYDTAANYDRDILNTAATYNRGIYDTAANYDRDILNTAATYNSSIYDSAVDERNAKLRFESDQRYRYMEIARRLYDDADRLDQENLIEINAGFNEQFGVTAKKIAIDRARSNGDEAEALRLEEELAREFAAFAESLDRSGVESRARNKRREADRIIRMGGGIEQAGDPANVEAFELTQ